MERRGKIVVSLLALLAVALPVTLSAHVHNDEVKAVSAPTDPTYTTSLPTTLDLNDTSDTDIRSYYSSLDTLDSSELQGTNLLKNLKGILKNMYYYPYPNVWKIYEITDRDWSLSSASETTYGIYDSSTNQITSYEYGSNSDTKNNPYMHLLYRDENYEDAKIQAWGDHEYKPDSGMYGFNREHVWAKSRGNFGETGPAGTDIHHLLAADARANGIHSNNCYGNVGTITTNAADTKDYLAGNYAGTSSFDTTSTITVFEPRDDDKGDIARCLFYMAARYNNYFGEGGISGGEANLALVNSVTESTTLTCSDDTPATMGILHDLLEWHEQDPVDEYEIHRNNLIYNNYQQNRNPFIDYPEWVSYIWGTSEDMTSQGSADPSNDTINGYEITLDNTSVTISGTSSATVTASSNNPSNTYTWSIDDTNIASLTYDGAIATITGIANGTATLTVTGKDGQTATCSITVSGIDESSSESSASSTDPTKQGFVKCTSLSDVTSGTYIIAANTSSSTTTTWVAASNALSNKTLPNIATLSDSLAEGVVKTGDGLTSSALKFEVSGTMVEIIDSSGNYIINSGSSATDLSSTTDSLTSYWTVSMTDSGYFRLTNSSTNRILLCRSNGNYEYFKAYTTSYANYNGYYEISLFRLTEASEYCVSFVNSTTEVCDINGVNTDIESLKNTWSTLSTSFASLSDSAKTVLRSDGNTDDYILNALSTYKYIVGKYSGTYADINDFMTLGIASNSSHSLSQDNNADTWIIIALISIVLLTSSIYIIRRSKKELD